MDIFWKLMIVVFLGLNVVLALKSRDSGKPGPILAGTMGFGLSR